MSSSKSEPSNVIHVQFQRTDNKRKNEILREILDKAKPAGKKKTTSTEQELPEANKKSPSQVNLKIEGNNNTQIAGDGFVIVNYNPPKTNIKILPPRNSIGEDPLLKNRIQTLFNKIGDERKKRFGQSAYPAMYNKFKTDFKIKNNKWTVIWEWPKECADEIICYLESKYYNTVQGRLERAASKKNYLHARPFLYKKEKELLSHLGLKLDSKEVKEYLQQYFGVTSHTKLGHLEHWQFVCYIEGLVNDIERN